MLLKIDTVSYNIVAKWHYREYPDQHVLMFVSPYKSTKSPYKILQGTLQNYEVREFLKKSVISVPLAL